jgi:hypothetical protein
MELDTGTDPVPNVLIQIRGTAEIPEILAAQIKKKFARKEF